MCVIKANYVVNRVLVDLNDTDYVYPFPHDLIVEDVNAVYGIGDWYEAGEQIMYRPINAIPPDWPDEISRPS